MKKQILKTFYDFGGFAPFRWANRGSLCVLMYHRFSRNAEKDKISAAEFTAHLDYLSRRAKVLSLSETVETLKNGDSLPPNAVVITIDDGYADAFDIAFPLLQKFRMPATVYAVTDFLDAKCWLWTDLMRYVLSQTTVENIGLEFSAGDKIETKLNGKQSRLETANRINARLKKMPNESKNSKIEEIARDLKVEIPEKPTGDFAPVSWEQARQMDAEKMQIESHTVTHPILTNINQTELDDELRESKKRLEEKLSKNIRHFCYPNGNLNEAVRKSVENAGYESAVTTAYGFVETGANQFLLNRIDAPPEIESFARSASGFDVLRSRLKSRKHQPNKQKL
jgi:peptidoglycan/xylan/chitin deacetylase (PgdA/CDA1 family)